MQYEITEIPNTEMIMSKLYEKLESLFSYLPDKEVTAVRNIFKRTSRELEKCIISDKKQLVKDNATLNRKIYELKKCVKTNEEHELIESMSNFIDSRNIQKDND